MLDPADALIIATGSPDDELLWQPLLGRLTLTRALEVFVASPFIERIILVVRTQRLSKATELCAAEGWQRVLLVDSDEPQEALQSGLTTLSTLIPASRWLIVHDAAYPLLPPKLLEAGLQAAHAHLAATAAVPTKDTVKQVDGRLITATLDRSRLWSLQSPQVASFPVLLSAYQAHRDQRGALDVITLLRREGYPVSIFPGSYANLKLTTRDDVLLAEAFLQGQTNL